MRLLTSTIICGKFYFIFNLHNFVVIFEWFMVLVVDFHYYHRLLMILIRTEDWNEIMKLEEELRFPTINSSIVEERNLTFINAVCKIYIIFLLCSIFIKKTNLLDCHSIEQNECHHWIQCENCNKNHLLCIWKVFVCRVVLWKQFTSKPWHTHDLEAENGNTVKQLCITIKKIILNESTKSGING